MHSGNHRLALVLLTTLVLAWLGLADRASAQVPPAPTPPITQLETQGTDADGWSPFDPDAAGSFMVAEGGVNKGVGSDENGTFNYLWWEFGGKKYRLRESSSPFYGDLATAEAYDKKIQINYDANGNVTSTWLF